MKRSLLYLDDEAACLDLFLRSLGEHYEVRTAETPAAARALLAERPAEIIISDKLMPDMDGTEFLREVAEKYPASCRVLLTGAVAVGGVLPQISNGIVQFFLTKPWTRQEMASLLERAGAHLDARARGRMVFS